LSLTLWGMCDHRKICQPGRGQAAVKKATASQAVARRRSKSGQIKTVVRGDQSEPKWSKQVKKWSKQVRGGQSEPKAAGVWRVIHDAGGDVRPRAKRRRKVL
jgi:hypothetical protein